MSALLREGSFKIERSAANESDPNGNIENSANGDREEPEGKAERHHSPDEHIIRGGINLGQADGKGERKDPVHHAADCFGKDKVAFESPDGASEANVSVFVRDEADAFDHQRETHGKPDESRKYDPTSMFHASMIAKGF